MPKLYTKNTWEDEELAGPPRFNILEDGGAAFKASMQIALSTSVVTAGTALDAEKMNNLEDGVDALDDLLKSIVEDASELTLAAGVITLTQSNHKLQPESGTADDLVTITVPAGVRSGFLYCTDYGTDTITIKHNTGNILCLGGADIALSNGCVAWYSDGTKVFIAGSGGGSSSFSWPGTALSYAAQDDKILIHDLSAGVDKYIEAQNLSKFGPQANALNSYSITGSGALVDYGGYFVEVTSSIPGAYLSCPVKSTSNHAYVVRNIGSNDVPIKLSDGTTITTLKAGETCLLIPSPTYDFKAFTIGIPTSYLDTDGTLAANSDTKIATQKATKTYVDTAVTGLLDFKGATDASGNPNYPSASKGDAYVVSVAGKIGGASGKSVDANDVYLATADNAGGTEASVGTSWIVLEHNLVGALLAANNLSDLTNQGTARTNLGMSADGSSLVTAANYAAMRTLLALVVGTNVQAYNSVLTTLAGASANGQSLVTAADYAAMLTLLFGVDVPENATLTMDDALSADGKYSAGDAEDGIAGEALAFGNFCRYNSSSKWVKGDADTVATAKGKAGFCVLAAAGDTSVTKILRRGKIRADAVFPAMTIGDVMYVSTTAGEITATPPSATNNAVRIVGFANTADELDIDISPNVIKKA